MVTRYEAEVLNLPQGFRTDDNQFASFIRQVHSRLSTEPGKPVPWCFDVRLHQPRYSEPGDRAIWERCLTLIPDGRTSRPDDCEWEPFGTEEDGSQPP